jgi:hypothetical protein
MEEEEIPAEVTADDRSAIAKEMEQVSDDGYSRKPEGEEREVDEPASEAAVAEPEVEEPETKVGEEQPPGEPPAEAPPEAPTQAELDDYEREIEAAELPKGASERSKEVIKFVRQKARAEHNLAKELGRKVEELEAREFIDENKAKEIEDLRAFKGNASIQEDLNRKYVPAVQHHEMRALSILGQHGLPKGTAEFIQSQGGLLRVRDSDARMPVGTLGIATDEYPDGAPFTGTQAQWYKDVLGKLRSGSVNQADNTRIEYHLTKAMDSLVERDEAYARARSNPQQYFQRQQEQQQAQAKDWTDRADAQAVKEIPIYGDVAKEREMPENPTKEQESEVLAHNARIETAKEDARQLLSNLTPENLTRMALALTHRDFYLKDEKPSLMKKLEQVTKERDQYKSIVTKAKGISQTSRQQASVRGAPERQEPQKYDAGTSIKELMEKIEA